MESKEHTWFLNFKLRAPIYWRDLQIGEVYNQLKTQIKVALEGKDLKTQKIKFQKICILMKFFNIISKPPA